MVPRVSTSDPEAVVRQVLWCVDLASSAKGGLAGSQRTTTTHLDLQTCKDVLSDVVMEHRYGPAGYEEVSNLFIKSVTNANEHRLKL